MDSDIDADPSLAQPTKLPAVSAGCGMTEGGSRLQRTHSLLRSGNLTSAERSEMAIRRKQEMEQGVEERLIMVTAQLALPSKGPQTAIEMEMRAKNNVAIVEIVAVGSKCLKGIFARGLKESRRG
ncbi:unnamed protein product [Euphydryas editha]|uniref:Uncharacterized protein n=1 Tax=Euphydryas editha TaxID=104508 RepID=A0AAU9UF15_EUPED|nr:unnamed protein product [Euphydryas editha]